MSTKKLNLNYSTAIDVYMWYYIGQLPKISYLACPSDGNEAVTSRPFELCIPHFCGGGGFVVGGTGLTGGLVDGVGGVLAGFFLQHTSISFLQVVILLSISIWTEFPSKISSKRSGTPPCLIIILLVKSDLFKEVLLILRTSFVGPFRIPEEQS